MGSVLIGLWSAFISLVLALFVVLLIGTAAAPEDSYTDYKIMTAGDNIYYLDENNQMNVLDSNYYIIVSENVKEPTFRILKYDNNVWLKTDSYIIVLPKE